MMDEKAKLQLIEMVASERIAMALEPPIEDTHLEIALWRALYKLTNKLTSLKAADAARKSVLSKKNRIKLAREHIDWAIEHCKSKKLKPNQDNIEAELIKLKTPEIFSDNPENAKEAIVKSNTIKEYLLELKHSSAEEVS